jgi:hypothetical protein
LIYVVLVPGLIGYLGYTTDVRWPSQAKNYTNGLLQGKYDLRNKLRGDTIAEW